VSLSRTGFGDQFVGMVDGGEDRAANPALDELANSKAD
jgi:hypothetical protein